MPPRIAHARTPLTGRDPTEEHRASTPLELLYDLTLVVAFGFAADELAHYVAEGHSGAAIVGFVLSVFGVSWAWLNYSWLASAYDNDDWQFRLATMTQMVGVVVLALGIEPAFTSIDEGDTFNGDVLIAGYVVMRVAMLFLWWRVSRDDPERRPAAHRYMLTPGTAQVLWVVFAVLDLSLTAALVGFVLIVLLELSGPAIAERAAQTPWHPHHITERYGLLFLITLGEGIIGTVAAINALVHSDHGWTANAALLAFTGVGLTFACWWAYFAIPWGEMLERRRDGLATFTYGYGHLVMFGAIAAIGAGLHVAAYALEDEAHVGDVTVVASVAIPLAVFLGMVYGLYSIQLRTRDPFHLLLLGLTAATLVAAPLLAAAGLATEWCLLVLLLAPVITVVGYETVGHRHTNEAFARLDAREGEAQQDGA
ncbi:low temperature requirement protein A [Patulibacter sp. NPDC049589]|uniref:low temperature requirement protein A n=1 Tax=Patulibacter sp. NPDC049589 TaxID=3154731 RepID=UPI0034294A47